MALVAWLVLLPFTGACLTFLLHKRDALVTAIGVAVPAGTLLVAAAAARDVLRNGPRREALGGWEAPLGIALHADGLTTLMILMACAVMAVAGVYATRHFPSRTGSTPWRSRDAFWPLWLFLLAGLNALFLSADVFNVYVILEVLTLAGVALVVIAGGRRAVTASTRYLLAMFLGSVLYLLGVTFAYAGFDALDVHVLRERVTGGPTASAALVLMTLGLMVKSALFPFHGWLPRAHATAPSPVSAALSALVVMASFYVIVRLWTDVFAGHATVAAAQLVGVMGAGAIVWGSFQALREDRLKLILAYSTVAQMGYLFLVIPLTTLPADVDGARVASWSFNAWAGALYQLFSHAFAKAALFLTAGTVIHAVGHDRLDRLGGLATTLPVATFTFGVAGIALIGLPPSGAFAAKWLLLTAAFGSGQWWWAVVIGAGTLLGAAYVFRVMRQAFVPAEEAREVRPVPWLMHVSGLALALTALLLGLFGASVLTLLSEGAPFPPAEGDRP